jgi:hypothetical protein
MQRVIDYLLIKVVRKPGGQPFVCYSTVVFDCRNYFTQKYINQFFRHVEYQILNPIKAVSSQQPSFVSPY